MLQESPKNPFDPVGFEAPQEEALKAPSLGGVGEWRVSGWPKKKGEWLLKSTSLPDFTLLVQHATADRGMREKDPRNSRMIVLASSHLYKSTFKSCATGYIDPRDRPSTHHARSRTAPVSWSPWNRSSSVACKSVNLSPLGGARGVRNGSTKHDDIARTFKDTMLGGGHRK